MTTRTKIVLMFALALMLIGAALMTAQQAAPGASAAPARPKGPCDIYAAAGDPCVAAHSTTRALYASYNGPLYKVLRQSDGKTLDIGVVKPSASDAGGYADAAAQDAFCANTYCWIATVYDQSPKHNDLTQAPRGAFSGPAMGGFNNVPVADMAPATIMGHKVYGLFIEPGMGMRDDNPKGTAVDDQAQGQYWVVNGHHYNSGCCFDYGNAETDSRDDDAGTMETTYFGNAPNWYHGNPPGPWVMTDQENNLVGCVNPDGANKLCASLPNITWRFVTAMGKGEPHHWTTLGGDAQKGTLSVMFDGPRVNASYDPMRKQGAILLGNGGDNSNGSDGTVYEGAMTAAGTFPTDATDQKVQANVVAARYGVPLVSVAPASALAAPPGLQTFTPGSSQNTTVTFTNSTGSPAADVKVSLNAPAGWTAVASGAAAFASVAPGAAVSATFKVTSGPAAFNGDLVGSVSWTNRGAARTETAIEKARNVSPVKINEFAVSTGTPANPTNSFIELYNAGASAVDISNWTLTEHPTQQAVFSNVRIPAATRLAGHGFYLLGLSTSGLAVPAHKGDATVYVRSATGMNVGDAITVGAEKRKIATLGTAAGASTTLWQPLPEGPIIRIPAGSTNVPYTATGGGRGGPEPTGFVVGEKIALGHGATYPAVSRSTERYEVVTVTEVGKPGTQARLAANAAAGSTNIKVTNVANISVGDKIVLDVASVGHGIETVTVTKVGTQATGRGANADPGTGLDLAAPLKFNHSANIPFSDRGTGITFKPATAFVHASNEPIQPLGTGITLDSALANDHAIDAVVSDAAVTAAGYQGPPKPNQWFGGPALSLAAGAMVLRDAAGNVVDSLNYGGLVDPWAAEGYQVTAGAGQSGCYAPAPGAGRGGGGRGGPAGPTPNRSSGRITDGLDTDSNCTDFALQTATTLSAAAAAGANNIKVGSVADFAAGQTILIDAGANLENAVIATVGTAGATTVGSATAAGATALPVVSAAGFAAGQSVTIDSGANRETAVVASIAGGRGGFGGGRGGPGGVSIAFAAPLTHPHAEGAEVAGSGITLAGALTKAHAGGAQVAGSVPTPGAPNQYRYRSRM